jgi:hypothetical protein
MASGDIEPHGVRKLLLICHSLGLLPHLCYTKLSFFTKWRELALKSELLTNTDILLNMVIGNLVFVDVLVLFLFFTFIFMWYHVRDMIPTFQFMIVI